MSEEKPDDFEQRHPELYPDLLKGINVDNLRYILEKMCHGMDERNSSGPDYRIDALYEAVEGLVGSPHLYEQILKLKERVRSIANSRTDLRMMERIKKQDEEPEELECQALTFRQLIETDDELSDNILVRCWKGENERYESTGGISSVSYVEREDGDIDISWSNREGDTDFRIGALGLDEEIVRYPDIDNDHYTFSLFKPRDRK